MAETYEVDIVAALGGAPDYGPRFEIYIPNKDRDGGPIEQSGWVREALDLLAKLCGGATAMPPVTGVWRNPESGELIFEEPVVVYAYVKPKAFIEGLQDLRRFIKRLANETNQGEIAVGYDGQFFTVPADDA